MTLPIAEKDQALLFHCTRQKPDGFPAFHSLLFGDAHVREIEVPCSGRVGVGNLMQGFACGYTKVAVLSCGAKSCVHGFGCLEAKKAMDRARETALIAGVDPSRLIFVEADDPEFRGKT